jgi:hypothetical protein
MMATMASAALPLTEVKLLARDGEMYVPAKSCARRQKEHAMRRRRLRAMWDGLVKLRQRCSSATLIRALHPPVVVNTQSTHSQ